MNNTKLIQELKKFNLRVEAKLDKHLANQRQLSQEQIKALNKAKQLLRGNS